MTTNQNQFRHYVLDLRANEYIQEALSRLREPLAKFLSKNVNLFEGEVIACKSSAEKYSFYDFNLFKTKGGDVTIVESRSSLINLLNSKFESNENAYFYISKTQKLFPYKDLLLKNIFQLIGEVKSNFEVIAVVFLKKSSIKKVPRKSDLSSISQNAEVIIFSTYNGAGYLIWKKIDPCLGFNKKLIRVTKKNEISKLKRMLEETMNGKNDFRNDFLDRGNFGAVPLNENFDYSKALVGTLKANIKIFCIGVESSKYFQLADLSKESLADFRGNLGLTNFLVTTLDTSFALLITNDYSLIAGSKEFLESFLPNGIEKSLEEFKEYAKKFDDRWNKNNRSLTKIASKYSLGDHYRSC